MILKFLLFTLSIFVSAKLLPGVRIINLGSAFGMAIILGILNIFLNPILQILALPITILTLGLFAIIVNAFVIQIASNMIEGVEIDGIFWSLIFGIIQGALANFMYHLF